MNDWKFLYSHNVAFGKPKKGIWSFAFPHKDGVHMVVKKAIKGTKEISMTCKIRGDGSFTTHNGQAMMRLYFQRKGDNWSGQGKYASYRWWNTNSIPIVFGKLGLTVPLKPEQWGNVMGKNGATDPQGFKDAWANAEWVGLSFGFDKGGAAHGVWMGSGKAKCVLLSFDIK